MGVYLSQPITDKVSNDYESTWLKCGVSSMQGWRSSQEDAHNCVLEYDKETSFFAVYDGHGGHEVAEYTARCLPEFLKSIEAYKTDNFEKALVDAFIEFDATLTQQDVIAKLKAIADENNENGGQDKDEDEVDVAELKEEANMPLTKLIDKYASGGGKNPVLRRVSASTTSSHPASPYLKAKPGKQDGAGSSKEPDGEEPVVNGVAETNGESEDKDSGSSEVKSTVAERGDSTDCDASSSSLNGDHSTEDKAARIEEDAAGSVTDKKEKEEEEDEERRIKSTIRIAKKKATVTMLAQLFEDNHSDSDSDNDESFNARDDTVSDEDEEEDEEEGEGEDEEEGDEEGEEEEDSEEDENVQFYDDETAGSESGCAAVVALLHKNKLYVANAGDSRAVLCREGTAVDLSIDHKPDDPIERQRIEKAGGNVTHDGRVNGGLNLSRALGDHYYKKCADVDAKSQMITALPDIQIADIDPSKDEFLVLACDGIWNSMSSQEVVDFVKPLIKQGCQLSSICEELFDKCLAPDTMGDGTGCDNMTCIIVTFSPSACDPKSPATTDTSSDSVKRSASPIDADESNKRPK